MGRQKTTNKTIATTNLTNTQTIDSHLEPMLKNTCDGFIAFDPQGKIIAINDKAAEFIGQPPKILINQNFWQQFNLNTYSRKRQFVQARKRFKLASEGMTQQFIWLETCSQKPVSAYNIMLHTEEIQGTKLVFTNIINVLQEKITEWVLWSLAKISNHHEINEVIDEILKLASNVFSADYASICLISNEKVARTVSHYQFGEKRENIHYSLVNSPFNRAIENKSISHFNDVQKLFPEDLSLKKMNVNSFLAGPIISAENHVVGLISFLNEKNLVIDELHTKLLRLFIDRINLEIERLLHQRKLQFLSTIPQQDPNPIIRILPSGDVVFANAQGKIILEYWMNIFSGIPQSILKEALKAQVSNKPVRFEMESDNKIYLFTLIWVPDFKQINIYGTDISQLKTTEQDMINLARFDALTRVANRQYFEEKILEKLHEHDVEGQKLAVLLIDLDDFKIINDTFGHPIGDRLLKAATNRMHRCLREDDFIARLGGDEFIVLLSNSSAHSATLVAEKLIGVLARTFIFGEYHMKISASIGLAIYPETALTTSDLLKHADIAMYQAKQSGKNSYAVFSKSLHFMQDKRNDVLKRDLRFAAARNELYVDYQPEIDISTNKIIGIEALVRWFHPEQGLVLPNEFIPLAERTGCIHLISQWLIEQSLADYAVFLKSNPTVNLSINISLSQLSDARFLDSFCDNLLEYNIRRNLIVLDISERSIAPHFKQISKSLRKIHKAGIKTCIDSFGSPQVSFPKLLAIPIDYLKLDQHLLHGIEKSPKHRMLLKGIINLATELQLNVIQKGIENKEQHDMVKSLGCRYAQGFYYSKPINIKELQKLMKEYLKT